MARAKLALFCGFQIVVAMGAVAVAHADVDYRPVQFFDQGLVQRSDLRGRPEDLQTPISDDRLLKNEDIERRVYGNVEVSLYSDVARFIQALKDGTYVNIEPTSSLNPPTCAQSAGFAPTQLPSGKMTGNCPARISAYENARKAAWENSCGEAEVPEAYVMRRPPGRVVEADMDNLEGLIGTLGEPLSKLDLPPALKGPSLINEMRIILRKVRLASLRSQLQARQAQLDALVTGLAQTDCLDAAPAQVASLQKRVSAVRDENIQMSNYLAQLENEGRAIAAQDKAKAQQAFGKKRNELPLPWMTDRERELLSMAVGGFYWRMRGGGLVDEPKGTQLTRIWFTKMPMAVLATLSGGSDMSGLGTDVWIRLFKGWGKYMDMGLMPGEDEYADLLGMTERGLYQVETAMGSLRSSRYGNEALQIGGMMMGPCYYASVKDLRNLMVSPESHPPYASFIDGFPAWGELCSGATITLGMTKALLAGHK